MKSKRNPFINNDWMLIKIKYYTYNLFRRKRLFLPNKRTAIIIMMKLKNQLGFKNKIIVQFIDGVKACMHLYTYSIYYSYFKGYIRNLLK